MQLTTFTYDLASQTWSVPELPALDSPKTLVLAFGAAEFLSQPQALDLLRRSYPKSRIIGCSSAGEIDSTGADIHIRDGSLSVAVARFTHTMLRAENLLVRDPKNSFAAGKSLARKLARPDLRAMLVLSDGVQVDGREFIGGIDSVVSDRAARLDTSIVVAGAQAGDGTRFERTWVYSGTRAQSGLVAAVALYGYHVVVGHGSYGDWSHVGPPRVVTRSDRNVIYELDGEPALALYADYLGESAANLQAAAALSPLVVRRSLGDHRYRVYPVTAVDGERQSLTCAGDAVGGETVQFIKTDFDQLIGGAGQAAAAARHAVATGVGKSGPFGSGALTLAMSSVGRRIALGERAGEEFAAVSDVLPIAAGFYSYGELSPQLPRGAGLHDQTMAVVTIAESPMAVAHKRGSRRGPAAPYGPRSKGLTNPRRPSGHRLSGPLQHRSRRSSHKLDNPPPRAVDALPRAAQSAARAPDPDPRIRPPARTTGEPGGLEIATFTYNLDERAWSVPDLPDLDSPRTLITVFGAPDAIEYRRVFAELRWTYPKSHIIGCSSAGEIAFSEVRDMSLSVAVARFVHTGMETAAVAIKEPTGSYDTGRILASKLAREDLRAVFVLSAGLVVNGSELLRGISAGLDEKVAVSGGLAGDGTRFEHTWVLAHGVPERHMAAAVGLYGDHLILGRGCKSGWDRFGPQRVVTRSEGNVLYALDGEPALQLYQRYLGDQAGALPAAGQRFPLSLRTEDGDDSTLLRAVLAVDEDRQCMTFAGDVPEGSAAQFMKADFGRVVGCAGQAAHDAQQAIDNAASGDDWTRQHVDGTRRPPPALAIAISSVGRRIVLGERIDEELEAVAEALAPNTPTVGFYSYGEIAPDRSGRNELHSHTIAVTLLSELAEPREPDKLAEPLESDELAAPLIGDSAGPQLVQNSGLTAQSDGIPQVADDRPSADARSVSVRTRMTPPSMSMGRPGTVPYGLTPYREVAHDDESSTDVDALAESIPVVGNGGSDSVELPGQSISGVDAAPRPPVMTPPPLAVAAPTPMGVLPAVPDWAPPDDTRSETTPWTSHPATSQEVRQIQSNADLWIARRDIGGMRFIEIAGRVSESFDGRACAADLAGTVIFDLAGVKRMTSFGIREWLEMLAVNAGPEGEELDAMYLARCSEAMVNQLIMMSALAGNGQIVSFFAPYLCRHCHQTFEHLIDCERDAEAIRDLVSPQVACPHCSSDDTSLDDDAASYLSFAVPHAGVPVPEGVRAAIADGASSASPLDVAAGKSHKSVTESETRIQIRGALDGSIRWPRLVEGVEGVLRIDLNGVSTATQTGLSLLDSALRSIKRSVERCELDGCPTEVLELLAVARLHTPIFISSAYIPGWCEQCEITRNVLIDGSDREFLADARVPCRRCNGPLSFAESEALLAFLSELAAEEEQDTSPLDASFRPGQGIGFVALLIAIVAAAAAGGALFSVRSAPPGTGTMVELQSTAGPSLLPPAWVERPFSSDGKAFYVVGRSGLVADLETAMAAAQAGAIGEIVTSIIDELEGSTLYNFVQSWQRSAGTSLDRSASIRAVAERYASQVGQFATPERTDAVVDRRQSQVEVIARYRLPNDAYKRAIAFYKRSVRYRGITVVPFFPAIELNGQHSQGDLVVAEVRPSSQAAQQGLAPGDVILKVNDQYVSSIEDYYELFRAQWRKTEPGGTLSLAVEGSSGARTVLLRKRKKKNSR
ncbi:MAG: FIST C-terminal domain-containing protein [Proteobacteria bacterium]|nr:FIST C-terminal domain-containing protein [Pseudomonadota bacterium]